MDLKKLFNDDDAVSPVIGVILMVAITVILAAVIASFVLGLGDQASQTTPTASFAFDYEESSGTDDILTITHDGGDTIEANQLSPAVEGATDGSGGDATYTGGIYGSVSEVSAGTTTTIDGSDTSVWTDSGGSSTAADLNSATVRIVYESDNGDTTSTLATFEGPDA